MKFLVLGSSGQVGSALSFYLESRGHSVIPFDIVRTPDEDLRRPSRLLERAVADADYVFFLAFDVGGSVYLAKYQNTFDFIHNNCRLMAVTFDALARYKKPFLFASSQMATMGFSNYGLQKAVGEKYTEALGGITVKFWNVYGVEHDPEKTHVITDFVNMARTKHRIDMRTNGKEERQFLFAEDCAEALEILALRDKELPRTANYHITNFEWTSVREVAELIAERFPGTSINPAAATDQVQQGQKNEADPFILQYWKPKTSMREGIGKIINSMTSINKLG